MTALRAIIGITGQYAGIAVPSVVTVRSATNAGAWTEMAGPHAEFANGKTYIAWVGGNASKTNDIEIAAYDNVAGTITGPILLHDNLSGGSTTSPDTHLGPALIVLPSGFIVTAYSGHTARPMNLKVSNSAYDITAGFTAGITITPTTGNYTYPMLAYTSANGRVWLFFRFQESGGTNAGIGRAYSTDGGYTWTGGTKLFQVSGNFAYSAFASNGTDRIDFAVTDKEPSDPSGYGLWHFYQDEFGDVFESDGTQITGFSYPLATSDLTQILATGNDRYPYSLSYTADDRPVIAVQSKAAATVHIGEYRWSGSAWQAHTIDTSSPISGSILSVGGGAHDWNNANRFVSAKMVTGSLEMMLYTSNNDGSTWTGTQLASSGANPNSPVYIRSAGAGLSWLWFDRLISSSSFDPAIEGAS